MLLTMGKAYAQAGEDAEKVAIARPWVPDKGPWVPHWEVWTDTWVLLFVWNMWSSSILSFMESSSVTQDGVQ